MALGSPGLHAAWILSFFCSFYHYLKRSFAFPSVRSALRGVFLLVFFFCPLVAAEDVCCLLWHAKSSARPDQNI